MRELVLLRRESEQIYESLTSDDPYVSEFAEEEPTLVIRVKPDEQEATQRFPLWAKILLSLIPLLTAAASAIVETLKK